MSEYRIDELARAAGTTVRNIRAYQDRGLLHPPRVLGRVGVYSESHLRRLRRVLSLLRRGYASAQIQELLGAWESGTGLAGVIDVEEAATGAWTDESPVELARADLAEQVGGEDQLARLVATGWATADGDRATFHSPALLDAFAEARELGWSAERLVDLHVELAPAVDAVAGLFVDAAVDQLVGEHGDTWVPRGEEAARTIELFGRLRGLTTTTVRVHLARALQERAVQAVDEHRRRVESAKD
ncbi:MAG: MerR family transcriptional regulator [Aeromicrobium erythreum]